MKKSVISIIILSVLVGFGADYPARMVRGEYAMRLEINGKPVYPHASRFLPEFRSDKHFMAEPGPVKEFSAKGVKILFVGSSLGWIGDGQFNYDAIDQHLRKALEAPTVYIIPAIDLGRNNSWWRIANPDERYMRMVNGKLTPRDGASSTASFFSDKFRDEASVALRNYIRHVEKMGWAKRVIGYQVNWGRAAEWIAWEPLSDMNPHALAKFREFLRTKYNGDVNALRKAWKDENVDFDNALPADNMMQASSKDGYIIDPADGRRIPDYVAFYRRRTTDMLLHFMGVVKDATNGKALVGTYASPGYSYQEFERIVTSDKIDFGVSSSFYFNREINGVSLTQSVSMETFRKNGKLYWHDADARTYLWPDERFGVSKNIYESVMSSLRRDFGGVFVKQMGITWFSLHPDRNVFADPAVMDDIGRIRAVCDTALQINADFSNIAETAVIFDPEIHRLPYRSNAPLHINYIKIGIPVDFYPLNDLKHLVNAKKQYKLIILLGCGYVTPQQRDFIKFLRNDNRTMLFMYANGIAEPDGFSVAAAEDLSGFKYDFVSGAEQKMNILPAWQKHFGSSMPLLGQINAPDGARRLCIIPATGDEVIATNDKDGMAAWAMHRHPDWTSIQFPGYQTYPSTLRKIAELAGISINYPYSDSSYQSCKEFISVTGGVGGSRKLALKSEAIYDIFNDQIIKPLNGTFAVKFLPYETKLLFVGTTDRIQHFREAYLENLMVK